MEIYPPDDGSDSFRELREELDQAFESITPTHPLPLVRKMRPSWEPPPLRKLIESTPPPPRPPMRSELELEAALCSSGVWIYDASLTDPTLDRSTGGRRRVPWKAVGVAYVLGATTVYAMNQHPAPAEHRPALELAQNEAPAVAAFLPPPMGTPVAKVATIATMDPLHITGYVTDPSPVVRAMQAPTPVATEPEAPTPKAIDLERLRIVVAALSASAGSCGRGDHKGSARVSITIAPSGRATSAVLQGGQLAGTRTGSCVARIMRSARVAPFDGPHVTVSKTIRVR